MPAFDVFVTYAHADRDRVLELRRALVEQGLSVWMDGDEIQLFSSISRAVQDGIAHSKALVVFYSQAYPRSRACQWELTAGFVAAQRDGADPRRRILVVNPEASVEHIHPVQLRDALAAPAPALHDSDAQHALAERIATHVAGLNGVLGAGRRRRDTSRTGGPRKGRAACTSRHSQPAADNLATSTPRRWFRSPAWRRHSATKGTWSARARSTGRHSRYAVECSATSTPKRSRR